MFASPLFPSKCLRPLYFPRHKIRCNQRCGKIRFGFDLAGDGKTLVVNLVEQEAIPLMTSLRAAGHTLRQIATELTSQWHPHQGRRRVDPHAPLLAFSNGR